MADTLHEIAAAYLAIWDRIDDETGDDGVIPHHLILSLDAVKGELTERWEELAKIICEIEREKVGLDAEIDRLKARSAQADKKAVQLREYLKKSMELAGHKKHKGAVHTITVAAKPPSVELYDEGAVPDEFCETRMTLHVSKTAIAAAIKSKMAESEAAGVEINPDEIVPGARLVAGTRLAIK